MAEDETPEPAAPEPAKPVRKAAGGPSSRARSTAKKAAEHPAVTPSRHRTSRTASGARTATARTDASLHAAATDVGRAGERPAESLGQALQAVGATGLEASRAVLDLAGVGMRSVRQATDSRGGLPVYVGAGAAAVVGVIGWPAAAAVGVGYAALRRWGGQLPEPLRSLTGSRAPTRT